MSNNTKQMFKFLGIFLLAVVAHAIFGWLAAAVGFAGVVLFAVFAKEMATEIRMSGEKAMMIFSFLAALLLLEFVTWLVFWLGITGTESHIVRVILINVLMCITLFAVYPSIIGKYFGNPFE